MSKHLQRDLDNLKKELLSMGAMVEEAINKAVLSLVERRVELAEDVIQGDDRINQKENQIEEECLKILALHQPVAADLRFIIVVLKVNNDLERMGDLCVNIAERAAYLATHKPLGVSLDFPQMIEGVRSMVHESLDALVNQDTALARTVMARDDEIDGINREMFVVLQEQMKEDSAPSSVRCTSSLLRVIWSESPTWPPISPRTSSSWWRGR